MWQVGFMANLSKCGAGWRELQYLGSYVGGPQIEKEVTRIHRILPPSQVQKNQRRWAVLGVGWLSVPVCNELSPLCPAPAWD